MRGEPGAAEQSNQTQPALNPVWRAADADAGAVVWRADELDAGSF